MSQLQGSWSLRIAGLFLNATFFIICTVQFVAILVMATPEGEQANWPRESIKWPIISLEIHHPICYVLRSVSVVFFENQISENQHGKAIPKRGKIAI